MRGASNDIPLLKPASRLSATRAVSMKRGTSAERRNLERVNDFDGAISFLVEIYVMEHGIWGLREREDLRPCVDAARRHGVGYFPV